MLHGIPSSSFTNDRHKWEDEGEDVKRELVLFQIGAIEDWNFVAACLMRDEA